MDRKQLLSLGAVLIGAGVIGLASSIFGWVFDFSIWQLWPVTVVAAGLLLTAPAVFVRNKRGMAVFYILGLPAITTGLILLWSSVFRWWDIWSVLWPLEVISVAIGCVLAAIKAKANWLLVPAIIIGANGAILQFCAITGWWGSWAVLWAVEPIAVGISLLTLNAKKASRALMTVGLVFCAVGTVGLLQGLAFASLSVLRPLWWLWRWVAPGTVILLGIVLLVGGLSRKEVAPKLQTAAE